MVMLHAGRAPAVVLLLLAVAPQVLAEDGVVAERLFPEVSWRLLGPYRGGWTTQTLGLPSAPDTYYTATAGGGLWKTEDSGNSWRPLTDATPVTSVGALAIAPSDAKVLYLGSGQPEPRYDIIAGSGVYRSRDGGETWASAGLADSRHIGALSVYPRDPNPVLAAVLGHVFGPGGERGVYLSDDGGDHWRRTLAIDDSSGAVDLARDPGNAEVIYAATWTMRVWPWLSYFTPLEGAGSAIHRSTDGGRTWTRLAGEGWPAGPLGRIGIAVTHVGASTRIYASVASEAHGGFYRSDDAGLHWQKVNAADWSTNWYTARVTVSPTDPDLVYTVGQSIHASHDGGKTFEVIRGAPGGDDYHHLWINPQDPRRMAASSDQGTIITVNGGRTWSSWYNQPTGQFYYLSADNQFPYWIYSGQQDSGTVGIASRSDYGALSLRDWHPVGGEERDYDLADPEDPGIVYGSGLGGRITKWIAKTGEAQNLSPWPLSSYGKRPTDFRFHYTWFTPLAFSKRPPYALYAGAQVLFRSLDRGEHWERISPDLSRRYPAQKNCDGDPDPPRAAACGYGVVNTIVPSSRDNAEIWVGTDDGRVWQTQDGHNWHDVTPAATPLWAKLSSIDLGASPGLAYVAIDNHRQDDFAPRVLMTRDYGRRWIDLSAGLPRGHFVSVVRADPVRAGLLYAGTDEGVSVSFDDGRHWQSLKRNLPAVWVHDLLVKDRDLIAATNGRGLWVLDDLSPLRQVEAGRIDARLYQPASAYRLRPNQNRDTPLTAETPLGRNPATGAVIDYWLPPGVKGAVVLEVRDSKGELVRRISSADPPDRPHAEHYFEERWVGAPARLAATPGAHRFVWDLRYPRPQAIVYAYGLAATVTDGALPTPTGPLALPGDYRLTLNVEGKLLESRLSVALDPRVTASAADLKSALEFSSSLAPDLAAAARAHADVTAWKQALEARRAAIDKDPRLKALQIKVAAFADGLEALTKDGGEQSVSLKGGSSVLSAIATDVEGADRAPTAAQREAATVGSRRIRDAVSAWATLSGAGLAELNREFAAHKLSPLKLTAAAPAAVAPEGHSRELP